MKSRYYHGRPPSGETPSDQLPQKIDKTFMLQTAPKRIEVDRYQKRWDPSDKNEPICWVVGEQKVEVPVKQLGTRKPILEDTTALHFWRRLRPHLV